MVAVDVLIMGGGVQGLALLDELAERGFGCVLVTPSDLGSGQTLHSHGLLNSGTGLLTGQLREPIEQALAFAGRRGLQLYGEDEWYLFAPGAAYEKVRQCWDVLQHPYQVLPSSVLPAGFRSSSLFDSTSDTRVIGLRGFNFPKRQLVRLLRDNHLSKIVRGSISDARCTRNVGALRVAEVVVQLHASGEILSITPKAAVIAAGAGTKRLIRTLLGELPAQLEVVTHTPMHMLCVRGPADVLPPVSFASLQHGLMSVAHLNHGHDRVAGDGTDEVTWYVTPAESEVSHEVEPSDLAETAPQPEVVARAIEQLHAIYPGLREVAATPDSYVRFGVYAGYKQNVGDDPIRPIADQVDGTSNLFVALPSVIANAWPNAAKLADLLQSQITPGGVSEPLAHAGEGVRVGSVNERDEDFEWRRWDQFVAAYGRAGT
jgi:glycine/D-amino acid oxidase-like deaminating enzyme